MKQQALEKMNTELQKAHSPALDQIHNWLCEQEDDELFIGIVKEGKTLDGALKYVISLASKQQVNRCAVMTDDQVYQSVVYYFKNEIKVEPTPRATVEHSPLYQGGKKPEPVKLEKPKPKVEPEPKKAKVQMEMSIFDFIDEPEDEDNGTDE